MTREALDLSLYFLLNLPCERDPLALAQEVIAGGVTTIQLRAKEASARELYEVALALQPLLKAQQVGLIINDRVDVAMAVGADGVHVGRDDLPVEEAKRIAPSLVIGASCYGDIERAHEMVASGADYIAFGSFFASPTKPQAPQIPLSVLEEARAIERPKVAIGGIQPHHVSTLCEAGADGVAVISAIQNAADPQQAASLFSKALASRNLA